MNSCRMVLATSIVIRSQNKIFCVEKAILQLKGKFQKENVERNNTVKLQTQILKRKTKNLFFSSRFSLKFSKEKLKIFFSYRLDTTDPHIAQNLSGLKYQLSLEPQGSNHLYQPEGEAFDIDIL